MKAHSRDKPTGAQVTNQQSNTTKLLAVYKVLVSAGQGGTEKESIMLEDPGSNYSIITHQLTRHLGVRIEQMSANVHFQGRRQ